MVRPHVSGHGQCNGGPGSLWGATLATPPHPHPRPTMNHEWTSPLWKKDRWLFGTLQVDWQHTLFLHAHQRWGGHPHHLICGKSSDFFLSVGAQSWGGLPHTLSRNSTHKTLLIIRGTLHLVRFIVILRNVHIVRVLSNSLAYGLSVRAKRLHGAT
jgi:hypothetical protein